MPIKSGQFESNIPWIHLAGTYASDAAAEAAWELVAIRNNPPETTRSAGSITPPEGLAYVSSATNDWRIYVGAAWRASGAAAAVTADDVYDNGWAVTVDNGAMTYSDSDAAAEHTIDIEKTGAGSGNILNIDIDAAHTGNVIDVDYTAAATGDVLNVLFTSAAATAQAVVVDSGTQTMSSTGWVLSGTASAITTGPMVALADNAAAATGDFIDVTVGTATGAIVLDINVNTAATVPIIDIDTAGAGSGTIIDIASAAAWTGDYLALNLTNALAAAAIGVTAAGARTDSWFEVTDTSTCNVPGFLYTLSAGGPPTAPLMQFDTNGQAFADGVLEFLLDGTTGASSAAIIIDEESAARTGYGLWVKHSGTSSSQGIAIDSDGAGGSGASLDIDIGAVRSGHGVSVDFTAAGTGDALWVDMNAGDVGAGALTVLGGGGRAFTAPLVAINTEAAGHSGAVFDLDINGVANSSIVFDVDMGAVAGTGNIFDFATAGAWNADVFAVNLTNANAASQVLVVADDALNHSTEGWLLQATNTGTGAGDWISLAVNGASSGHAITVDTGAVNYSGSVLFVNYDNATLASRVLDIDTGNGLRTVPLIDITDTSTCNVPAYNHDIGGILAAPAMQFDVNADVQQPIVDLKLASQVTGGGGILVDDEAAARAGYSIQIAKSGAGAGSAIDIPVADVAFTGDIIDVTYTGNSAVANRFLDLNANAANRTVPWFDIDSAETGDGNNHLFDIDYSGIFVGNVFDVGFTTTASGDVIHILLDNTTAAQAMVVDTNATFTNPLVQIISDTGSPTAACIDVASTGVGANGVAAVLDIDHSGALVQGSRVARFVSTGNFANADGHVVHIEQNTGAGVVGNHALYVNATGANVEGIRVDAGTSTFDETVTIGDGTNGISADPSGANGVVYAGTCRPTKRFWLSAKVGEVGFHSVVGGAISTHNYLPAWILCAGGAGTDSVRFALTMPDDYADGTEITLVPHVGRSADSGNDGVTLRIDYASFVNTDDLTTALTSGSAFSFSQNTTNLLTIVSDASCVIPAGAGVASSELLEFEVVRLGDDAGDTSTDTMFLLGVEVRYTADRA